MSIALLIFASILLGAGIYLLYFLDRDINETEMYKVAFAGLTLVILAIYLLFMAVPKETLMKKLAGLILSIAGFWMTFKFPSCTEVQGEGYAVTGIFFGLMLLVFGIFLLLL